MSALGMLGMLVASLRLLAHLCRRAGQVAKIGQWTWQVPVGLQAASPCLRNYEPPKTPRGSTVRTKVWGGSRGPMQEDTGLGRMLKCVSDGRYQSSNSETLAPPTPFTTTQQKLQCRQEGAPRELTHSIGFRSFLQISRQFVMTASTASGTGRKAAGPTLARVPR